ncbi:MAG: hypothetical protein V2A74_01140 [bacterium]
MLFARGKINETTLATDAPAGTRIFSVDVGTPPFDVGDPIFVGAADGSKIEWLGRVVAVQGSAITMQRATRLGQEAGATVWSPAAIFEMPDGPADLPRREFLLGLAPEWAVGGTFYQTRIADPARVEHFEFHRLTASQIEAFRTFVETPLQSGLVEFTYVDAQRHAWRVSFAKGSYFVKPSSEDLFALTFDLALLEENSGA